MEEVNKKMYGEPFWGNRENPDYMALEEKYGQLPNIALEEKYGPFPNVPTLTLTLADVQTLQKTVGYYLAAMSRESDVDNYVERMTPVVNELSNIQYKLDYFATQLLNTKKVINEQA